ncbi:hypothetical protein AB0283_15745 [Micromonospora vinacea]|uniref:hypothetical protein n=1 Tax=Micromonospora vinacea TaxID=709878 RepID=UPI00344C4038
MTTPPTLPKPGRHRRWWGVLAVLITVVVVVCACAVGWVRQFGVPLMDRDYSAETFVVENHRESKLTVEVTGGVPITHSVSATSSALIPLRSSCERLMRLVARDPAGREIASLDDALCEPRTWVIEADGSTQLLRERRWPYLG